MSDQPLDLSKYEGHTPANWAIECCEAEERFYVVAGAWPTGSTVCTAQREPDARLIADAPLLLAEVERQQAEIAALRVNDARYKHLRANPAYSSPAQFDAEVDSEIAARAKGEAT